LKTKILIAVCWMIFVFAIIDELLPRVAPGSGLSFRHAAYAGQSTSVKLAWNPSTDKSVAGYKIHYGIKPGKYIHTLKIKGRFASEAVIGGLKEGKTYFFAITSYDSKGKESAYSPETSTGPVEDLRKPKPEPAEKAPESEKIPASKRVSRTPDGKILPSR